MNQYSSRSGNEGLLAFDTGGDATSLLMSLNENADFGPHHNKPRYQNFLADSRIKKRCQRENNNQMKLSGIDMEVCRFQCMGHFPTNTNILADRPMASIARAFTEKKSGVLQGRRTHDGKILNLDNLDNEFNQIEEEKNSLMLLPAVSSGRTEDQKMRYVWDGKVLKAIGVKDAERLESSLDRSERRPIQNKHPKNSNSIARNDQQKKRMINWNDLSSKRSHPPSQLSFENLEKFFSRYLEGVKAAFFPNPASVTPDYWSYAAWRGTHRLFSSISSVFATQSLLMAVGEFPLKV